MPKTAKTTKTQSSKRKMGKTPMLITPEQRQQMISEAAYYLAEQRGFERGDPVVDWIQAEEQIDKLLH